MSTVKLDNRDRIYNVSEVSTPELLKYYDNSRKNSTDNSSAYDIVFFTKNEDHHGDIYFHDKLYTYFHDIDYSYNTIMNDIFTCRLTRDREYHTLQLTYLTCDTNEVQYDVDETRNLQKRTLIFTFNNSYVENPVKPDDTENIHLSYNTTYYNAEYTLSGYTTTVILSQKQYNNEYKDNFVFTYIHNGQEYNYNIPVTGYHTKFECTSLSISPKYSYLYEGQSLNLTYYYTPKNTTDKFVGYNLYITYNSNTTNELCYDVAYIKCGDKVSYSYIYMREPQIEDIKFYLYSTDTYLKSGQPGKIAMTIYPPELNTYICSLISTPNINSVLSINSNDTVITNIKKDNNNVCYIPTAYNYGDSEYYQFTSADQYRITGTISYKGQVKIDNILYAVGIEPKSCNAMYIDPTTQSCHSNMSSDNSSPIQYKVIVYREYDGLDFFGTPSHRQCIIKNLQYDFEYGVVNSIEPYTFYSANNPGFNPSEPSKYYEEITFEVFDDLENESATDLIIYANDGSHLDVSCNITIDSNYITPKFIDDWYIRDITTQNYTGFTGFTQINPNTSTVCTLSRHNYDIAIKCSNNPTIIDYLHFGESSSTSAFNCENCRILNTGSNSYVVFTAKAKAYLIDDRIVKFFINDKFVNIKVKNEGTELNSIMLNQSNVIYGIDNQQWFNISYDPILAANVSLLSVSNTFGNGVNINYQHNSFPWTYNVSFNNLTNNGNSSADRYSLNVKLRQKIDETTNFDIETNYSLFIYARKALLTSNITSIDLSETPSQNVIFTITNYNIPANDMYIGWKEGNNSLHYENCSSGTFNKVINSEGTFSFAVYHKLTNSNLHEPYVKISNEVVIPSTHNIHYVENIYDMWFENTKNCVNDEIKLYFTTDNIVNSLDNLNVSLNSTNYQLTNKSFTSNSSTGRKTVECIIKSNSSNISSLSAKHTLTATILSTSKSTEIYPYITSCIVKTTRNNELCNYLFENGANNYNTISLSAEYKNRNGNVITSANTIGAQYTVQYTVNSNFGYILGTTFYGNIDKVGKFKIEHKIDNSENKYYYSDEITQFTAPVEIIPSKLSVQGYSGYSEDITLSYRFKSIFDLAQYNQYKNSTGIYYWYGTDESSSVDLSSDTINVKTNLGNLHIKCKYNTIQEDIVCKQKEFVEILGSSNIYAPGNIDKFIQVLNIRLKDGESSYLTGSQVCSLGEDYNISSSITDNIQIEFLEGSQYNTNIYAKYDLDRNIGENTIMLNTSIDSSAYIAENKTVKLSQVLIPIRVESVEINDPAAFYPFSTANETNYTVNVGGQYKLYKTSTNTQPSILYDNLTSVNVNNIYYKGNVADYNNLTSYLFVHEYAQFNYTVAYNDKLLYSRIYKPDSIYSTYMQIVSLNNDWSKLRNGEYYGAGSYITYMEVLWYDKPISEILPKTEKIIDNKNYVITYQGIINSSTQNINNKIEGQYVIPLSYFMVKNNIEIRNTLDEHLLSRYLIETGSGTNINTPTDKLDLYTIILDASGSGNVSLSASCANNLSKLETLKIKIKYLATFPGSYNEYEIPIIENGIINTSLTKNELYYTFAWWFEATTRPIANYTMSISEIKYKFKIQYNSNYNGISINNVYIKYQSTEQTIVPSSADLGLFVGNSTITWDAAQIYFNAVNCKHYPSSAWNGFMLNFHHRLYTINTTFTKL